MNESVQARKDWGKTWTTAAAAIHGALTYTDKKQLSLIDVMGLTGHAFRINIDPLKVDVSGPTSFPGGYMIRRNLCNLGFTCSLADPAVPVTPDKLERVITLIQQSIDRGFPAIGWDLFIPEFGLIYGYDDEKQCFYAKDVSKDGTLSYATYGQAKFVLFAVTIGESLPQTKSESLRLALDVILDHARGREWQHIFKDKYIPGLAAYDAWIQVFAERKADEVGNAYNTAVVADARRFAARFLRELPTKWGADTGLDRNVRKLAEEAAAHFEDTAASLWILHEMFPFPRGGEPNDPGEADRAIQLLKQAKEAETKGIEVLEKLQKVIQVFPVDQWIH